MKVERGRDGGRGLTRNSSRRDPTQSDIGKTEFPERILKTMDIRRGTGWRGNVECEKGQGHTYYIVDAIYKLKNSIQEKFQEGVTDLPL